MEAPSSLYRSSSSSSVVDGVSDTLRHADADCLLSLVDGADRRRSRSIVSLMDSFLLHSSHIAKPPSFLVLLSSPPAMLSLYHFTRFRSIVESVVMPIAFLALDGSVSDHWLITSFR